MEEPPLFYAGQRSQGLRWPEPEKSDDSLQSGHHILGRNVTLPHTTPTIKPTHICLQNAGFSTSGRAGVTQHGPPSKRHNSPVLFPMLASTPSTTQMAPTRNKTINDHNEHMCACIDRHLRRFHGDQVYHHYYSALHHILRVLSPFSLLIFRFLLSADVSIFFFPPSPTY